MEEFKTLNLKPELIEVLKLMKFHNMTEVQEVAIPAVLQHKDIIVRSKTGSGKTLAFLIPIFQSIEQRGYPQALVIVPTRELALQVSTVAYTLGSKSRIRSLVVYGGVSINPQLQSLHRGSDLIIGTPGRILDLVDRGALNLGRIKILVLDEADMMLDMGFIDDVEKIIGMAPRDKQILMFSATIPREVEHIAKRHMKGDMARLTVGAEEELTVTTISHYYYIANGKEKFSALLAYIDRFKPRKCIIFTSTQREAEFVHRFLEGKGFNAIVTHGGLSQARREVSMRAFKEHATFLISTNLASRGLDIPDISDIINFDPPEEPKVYVHRVGRSARMGKDGRAFTLYGFDQKGLMEDTKVVANIKMNHIDLDVNRFRNIALPFQERRGRRDFHDRRNREVHGEGRSHEFHGRRDFHEGRDTHREGAHRKGRYNYVGRGGVG